MNWISLAILYAEKKNETIISRKLRLSADQLYHRSLCEYVLRYYPSTAIIQNSSAFIHRKVGDCVRFHVNF